MVNSLSVIILTFNEEKHIERCLKSVQQIADTVYIIDSYSTDRTCAIAEEMGARVYKNAWVNYATQFNWALENCPLDTEWTMRMDCDEYMLPELVGEVNARLPLANAATGGFIMKRRVYFMDRWIKHGGFYPHRLLRIWRTGKAKIEERWMDEHVVLEEGVTETFEHDLVDHNLNNLSWWINKHNNYADREVLDLLAIESKTTSSENVESTLLGEQYSRKRWIKEKVYSNIPLFVRPFFYFVYRYFILFGFLDGMPGLIWHFLQGYWYRFLVDAKVYELRLQQKKNSKSPQV